MEFAQILFQSTLRRTERLLSGNHCNPRYDFNPRSDERSDGLRCVQLFDGITFQSTLRRTERQVYINTYAHINVFQSTLRRTERLFVFVKTFFIPLISIHAPTNGATAILHKKMKKTIQNRLIILLFSTNSLRLLCSCTQYSFFLFIFHGANDLVILCSLSFRTTSKN